MVLVNNKSDGVNVIKVMKEVYAKCTHECINSIIDPTALLCSCREFFAGQSDCCPMQSSMGKAAYI